MTKKLLLFLIPLVTSQLIFDLEKIILAPLFVIYSMVLTGFILLERKKNEKLRSFSKKEIGYDTKKTIHVLDFVPVILIIPGYILYISLGYTVPIRGDAFYHSSSMQHFSGTLLQTIRGVNMIYLSLLLLILIYVYVVKTGIKKKFSTYIFLGIIITLSLILYLSINIDLGRYRYPQQFFFLGSVIDTFFSDLLLNSTANKDTYYFQLLKLTNFIVFSCFFLSLKKIGTRYPLTYILPIFFLLSNKTFLYYLNSSYLDIPSLLFIMLGIYYLSTSEDFQLEYYYLILSLSSMFKEYGIIAIAASSLIFLLYKKSNLKSILFYTLLSLFPWLVLYLNQGLMTTEYSRPFIFLMPNKLFFTEYFSNIYFLGISTILLIIISLIYLLINYKKNISIKISIIFVLLCFLLISIDQTNSSYAGYSRFYLPLYLLIFTFLFELGKRIKMYNQRSISSLLAILLVPLVLYSYPKIQTDFNFIEFKDSPIYIPDYSSEMIVISDEISSKWSNMLSSNNAYSLKCVDRSGKTIWITINKINYLTKYPDMNTFYIEDIVRDKNFVSCNISMGAIGESKRILYFDKNILISTEAK